MVTSGQLKLVLKGGEQFTGQREWTKGMAGAKDQRPALQGTGCGHTAGRGQQLRQRVAPLLAWLLSAEGASERHDSEPPNPGGALPASQLLTGLRVGFFTNKWQMCSWQDPFITLQTPQQGGPAEEPGVGPLAETENPAHSSASSFPFSILPARAKPFPRLTEGGRRCLSVQVDTVIKMARKQETNSE